MGKAVKALFYLLQRKTKGSGVGICQLGTRDHQHNRAKENKRRMILWMTMKNRRLENLQAIKNKSLTKKNKMRQMTKIWSRLHLLLARVALRIDQGIIVNLKRRNNCLILVKTPRWKIKNLGLTMTMRRGKLIICQIKIKKGRFVKKSCSKDFKREETAIRTTSKKSSRKFLKSQTANRTVTSIQSKLSKSQNCNRPSSRHRVSLKI